MRNDGVGETQWSRISYLFLCFFFSLRSVFLINPFFVSLTEEPAYKEALPRFSLTALADRPADGIRKQGFNGCPSNLSSRRPPTYFFRPFLFLRVN